MSHVHAGRLNGIHADPGTILGPKAVTREYVTVTGNDAQGLTLGYARADDLDAEAVAAMAERGPRSVAEHHIIASAQAPVVARLRQLFG
jgi:hypothetical protein